MKWEEILDNTKRGLSTLGVVTKLSEWLEENYCYLGEKWSPAARISEVQQFGLVLGLPDSVMEAWWQYWLQYLLNLGEFELRDGVYGYWLDRTADPHTLKLGCGCCRACGCSGH